MWVKIENKRIVEIHSNDKKKRVEGALWLNEKIERGEYGYFSKSFPIPESIKKEIEDIKKRKRYIAETDHLLPLVFTGKISIDEYANKLASISSKSKEQILKGIKSFFNQLLALEINEVEPVKAEEVKEVKEKKTRTKKNLKTKESNN